MSAGHFGAPHFAAEHFVSRHFRRASGVVIIVPPFVGTGGGPRRLVLPDVFGKPDDQEDDEDAVVAFLLSLD